MSLSIGTQTDSNMNVSKRTFTSFPRLPLELRLKVWHLSIPDQGRTVAIRRSKASPDKLYTSNQLPPAFDALFNASQESRAELVRSIKSLENLCLSANDPGSAIRFDFHRDTLYLNQTLCCYRDVRTLVDTLSIVARALEKDQTERIQRLAIHTNPDDLDFMAFFSKFSNLILRFRGLKHLTVVTPEVLITSELPDIPEEDVFVKEIGGPGTLRLIFRYLRNGHPDWQEPELLYTTSRGYRIPGATLEQAIDLR